ncbi:response regulator transcription factor [Dermatophilaceae bacterium Soc4.6]
MTHVLVIEDDPAIRTALIRALTDRGHAVSSASTGMSGLQTALDERPDLVLLDLGLPDVDGFSVLTMLRAVQHVPVVVVTARDDDPSIVKALDAGADDYVVKPFGMDHLEARIRAVLRRSATGGSELPLRVGDLVIDPARRVVVMRDVTVELSRREFDLLELLARREGEVVTKRDILAEVWNQPYGGGERTVDVHLSWLRRKLGETAAQPVYLHSVRGVGVRLAAPVVDAPCSTPPPPEAG